VDPGAAAPPPGGGGGGGEVFTFYSPQFHHTVFMIEEDALLRSRTCPSCT